MLVRNILYGVGARQPATHADFHIFVGIQAGSRAAAEGLLAGGTGGHFKEIVADILEDIAGLFQEAHAASGVAGVMISHPQMVVAARIQLELAMLDKVGGELDNVRHLGAAGIVEAGPGNGGNRHLEKVGRTVHGVHVLVDNPPHVAAFAAQDPFDAKALGFGVHLGIQPLHGFVGGEEAEVAAFRGVRAPGVIQPDFVEEHQITHEGVGAGVGKDVPRGGDEKYFRPFSVERRFHPNPIHRFDLIHEKLNHVLKGVRLNTEVIAIVKAVGRGAGDPVDVAANEVEQLPADDGDFRRIDPVRAKNRAAAAFGALEEVVKPLLEDIHGEFPAARELAKELAGRGEVVAIDRAQQLRPEHRHVLGITRADPEMTFVGTGAAAHANVHKQLERPVLIQPFANAFEDNFFPILGKLPIFIGRRPFPGIGEVKGDKVFWFCGITPRARPEDDGSVHPAGLGRLVIDRQFMWFWDCCHSCYCSFSTGSPASIIFSRK